MTKGNPAWANFLWFWNSQRYRPPPQQRWFSNPWNQRHGAGKARWKAPSLTRHAMSGCAPGGRTEADGGGWGFLGPMVIRISALLPLKMHGENPGGPWPQVCGCGQAEHVFPLLLSVKAASLACFGLLGQQCCLTVHLEVCVDPRALCYPGCRDEGGPSIARDGARSVSYHATASVKREVATGLGRVPQIGK